jgi:RNA polymerase sigma factor for flagellar operon FliA
MSQFIDQHLAFVRRLARMFTSRSVSSPTLDFEDLVQAGVVGLLEAEERFDPSYGVPFRAFARKRVIGAMQDELRRVERRGAATVSIDARGPAWSERLANDAAVQAPADELAQVETTASLAGIHALSRKQRLILAYAAAGYRQAEIGAMLGVSPSRVRQLLDDVRSKSQTSTGKPLSEREREVLAATADGFTAKEVARRLEIAPGTVQDHRRNAATKLGAKNTTHAVSVAYQQGLLPLSRRSHPWSRRS